MTTYHIPVATIFLAFILAMGGIAVIGHSGARADEERISCKFIKSEGRNPQEVFESNKVKYKRLDRDGDDLACESIN